MRRRGQAAKTGALSMAGVPLLPAVVAGAAVTVAARAAVLALAGNLTRHLRSRLRSRADMVQSVGVGTETLMLRALCHELRPPISTLGSLTRALTDQSARLTATDRRAMLQLAREQALHLDGVWREAVALATGAAGDDRRIPLRQVLPAVVGTGPPGRIRVRISHAAGRRQVPVPRIRQVLINLVENALRHGPPQGRVRISASIRRNDLVLVVADEGDSCEPLLAALRQPAPPAKGAGLGLWIVRRMVEAEGGSVDAYPLRPSGVAVEVVLPGNQFSRPLRAWPRWAAGWPRRAGRRGMSSVSAIRYRGGHRVQPREGSTVRGQAGRA